MVTYTELILLLYAYYDETQSKGKTLLHKVYLNY